MAEAALVKKLFSHELQGEDTDGSDIEDVQLEKSDSEEDTSDEEPTAAQPSASRKEKNEPKAVWSDEDDEKEEVDGIQVNKLTGLKQPKIAPTDAVSAKEYRKRLRETYQKASQVGRTPKWAKIEAEGESSANRESDDSDGDEVMSALREMTKSTGKYITKSTTLPKTYLATNKLKDITVGHAKGALSVVRFHPSRAVLVTGSSAGRIALFEVCEDDANLRLKKSNNFLQEVEFQRFGVDFAEFYDGGRHLMAGSARNNYFFSYDLLEGKVTQVRRPQVMPLTKQSSKFAISHDGTLIAVIGSTADVYVFAIKAMEHLHTFYATGKVVDVCFSSTDNSVIYAMTEHGNVYAWDLRRKGEQNFFRDEGSVRGTCLAASPNGQFIACGSNTGVVNVYDTASAVTTEQPKPLYVLNNLTTSASFLRFNHDSQMMAFGSNIKRMASRILHVSSGTVFQNFPAKQEMLEKDRISCADFSPHSAFLALGNEFGTCRLYRVNHFQEY